jgi:hypothetical protein
LFGYRTAGHNLDNKRKHCTPVLGTVAQVSSLIARSPRLHLSPIRRAWIGRCARKDPSRKTHDAKEFRWDQQTSGSWAMAVGLVRLPEV